MTSKTYGLTEQQLAYNEAINRYLDRPSEAALNSLKASHLENKIGSSSLIQDIAKRHFSDKHASKPMRERTVTIDAETKVFLRGIDHTSRQKGLPNLGNTCWGNSTLQAFVLSNPEVKRLLTTPLEKRASESSDDFEARKELQGNLKALNDEYAKPDRNQSRITELLTQVWTSDIIVSSRLRPMEKQEDAPEFLGLILETLDADKSGRVSFEERSVIDVTGKNTTNHKSDSTNQIIKAKGLGTNPTIQKTVDQMFTTETLSDYKHEDKVTPATKRIYYRTVNDGAAPASLAVQLPRFAFDGTGKKVTTPIKGFDQEIKVPFHDDKGNLVKHGVYQVDSVVLHLGSTLQSGHYITLLRTDSGWEERNDSFVRSISTEEAHRMMENQGYLVRMTCVREEAAH